jgi:hypothetical protein
MCCHGHQSTQAQINIVNLELLDAPSLATAILAVVSSHLGVLVHVVAHVVEVVEAPFLRDPLRGLAVFCDQTIIVSFTFTCPYAPS